MAHESNPQTDPASVENDVAALDDDVVFAMSLGSKELFHSNLLGWFSEKAPSVGRALVAEWSGTTASSVRALREHRHLDLVLCDDLGDGSVGPARVVVENKMFALPDLDQLRKYGAEVEKLRGEPVLVLLSLADPGWTHGVWRDERGHLWRHCSYRALARRLRSEGVGRELDLYAAETFGRWLALIERLLGLVELLGAPSGNEPIALPSSALNALRRRRLDVPMQKLRAHYLASLVRAELEPDELEAVVIKAGVAHGVALVEAFVTVGDGVELGWQLQGDQWRLALRVERRHLAHGRGDEHHQQRARLAREMNWTTFDHEHLTGRDIGPRGSASDDRFGKFEPDFVYRYANVAGLTVDQAVDVGCHYIRAAQRRGSMEAGAG